MGFVYREYTAPYSHKEGKGIYHTHLDRKLPDIASFFTFCNDSLFCFLAHEGGEREEKGGNICNFDGDEYGGFIISYSLSYLTFCLLFFIMFIIYSGLSHRERRKRESSHDVN